MAPHVRVTTPALSRLLNGFGLIWTSLQPFHFLLPTFGLDAVMV